jgi:hypothetical protein
MATNPLSKAGPSLAKHVGAGGEYVVRNLNPLDVLKEYVAWRKIAEEQKTERQRIFAKRDVAVLAIEAERDVLLEYFRLRFSERKHTLDGMFRVLHTAVEDKNDSAMDAALNGILEVVKDNPLKDFETFRASRAKGEILEI